MTNTWYRTTRSSYLISPVEVVKETDKSVLVQSPSGGQCRSLKVSDYERYHKTAHDALVFLRNRIIRERRHMKDAEQEFADTLKRWAPDSST